MAFRVKHRPGTSVVVSTFNRVSAALRLVRQLAAQKGHEDELEILLVNDNGDPSVLELARTIECPKSVRIRCFDTGYAGYGLVLARNTGLRFASHENVIFLDDDMEVEPDFVSRYQQAPKGIRLGKIDFRLETPDGPQLIPDSREIMKGQDRLIESFEPYIGYLYGGNFCILTAFALVLGGFDEAFLDEGAEDTDFGLRAIIAGQGLVVVPSARAIHDGLDLTQARGLGLTSETRVCQVRERMAQRSNFIANGGIAYWDNRQWLKRLR